jgi:hypothetical protein
VNWAQRICAALDKWQALHRLVSVATAIVLSYVFIEEAKDRTVDWTDYIVYSLAMAMSYSPSLLVKALDALVAVRTGKVPVSADVRAVEIKPE